MNAWARVDDHAGRRFSVHVDAALEAGAPAAEAEHRRILAEALLQPCRKRSPKCCPACV